MDAAVLGARHYPPIVRWYGNRKNVILWNIQWVRDHFDNNPFCFTLWPTKSIVHGEIAGLSMEVDRRDKVGVDLRVAFSALLLAPSEARTLTSQYFKDLSRLPLTRPFPSGVNATLYTLSLWPRSRSSRVPDATSHIRTMVSKLPAATRVASGEKVTDVTPGSFVSLTVSTLWNLWYKSQIRIVLPPEPEMMKFPSLEKSREWTFCWWPSKTCWIRPLAMSHIYNGRKSACWM